MLIDCSFEQVTTGTDAFEEAIPHPPYRTQVVQHATALQLDYVLLVFSVPGAMPIKMVLVQVSAEHRRSIAKYQSDLTEYMPFLNDGAPSVIPSLGPDHSPPYSYFEEHMTLEEYLLLSKAYTKDVLDNGTPPPWV